MNEINFISCVLNSRVRVGCDVGTIKFIGEVRFLNNNVKLNFVIKVHRGFVATFRRVNVLEC